MAESPIAEHMGDMYVVRQCEDGHTEDGRLCRPMAVRMPPSAAAAYWQLQASVVYTIQFPAEREGGINRWLTGSGSGA